MSALAVQEIGPGHRTAEVDAVVSTGRAISAPMVAALELAWSAIRDRHPELPAVVVVLGAGSGDRGGLRLGHFAAMRWSTTDASADGADVEQLAEVFVGGEGLARGPVDVLGTLLHEAAHALAHARGIQDTSRQGRWHNARFKAIAAEVGIAVEKDPKLGWSPTTVPDATQAAYGEVIEQLRGALRMRRASESGGPAKPKKPGPPPCVCGCGRRIRVAASVRELGPIVCGVCDQEFAPEQDEAEGGE
ncbi:hypothetical protein Ae717Ps2_6596 [Pseudonocardia sp. Ae717_Ps2]|uniref:hypothetical protein n=1 Tax=Pseudonocardia sp. Ae717_Ps2 TaxID=1885573 RepID=UPI00096123DF|nr:hypothetical protein [Pseudonocardia sp. Ae717_Ps2]OLM28257.1 hypothetical protein Ae717Ps2_6596 [Pseudonocardia sp. Ae717_Ps2]